MSTTCVRHGTPMSVYQGPTVALGSQLVTSPTTSAFTGPDKACGKPGQEASKKSVAALTATFRRRPAYGYVIRLSHHKLRLQSAVNGGLSEAAILKYVMNVVTSHEPMTTLFPKQSSQSQRSLSSRGWRGTRVAIWYFSIPN